MFHTHYIWMKLGEGEVSQTARARTGVLDDGDMLLIFTAFSLNYKQIILFGFSLIFFSNENFYHVEQILLSWHPAPVELYLKLLIDNLKTVLKVHLLVTVSIS